MELRENSKKIALVDCHNFFVSCERVFRPDWQERPLAVLSNHDGCVIARSNEVKSLGVQMGAPYFKVKELLERAKVQVVSSNFALYGDLSSRVMQILSSMAPTIEIYSIDEAFIELEKLKEQNIFQQACHIAKTVLKQSAIPVGIGIAPTKVLAKVASHIVKKKQIASGVFEFQSEREIDQYLRALRVNEIWGIGPKIAKKLHNMGIFHALALKNSDPREIRTRFNVCMERVVLELKGISCLYPEDIQTQKQILVSNSFSQRLTKREEISQILSCQVSKATKKLRAFEGLCSALTIFIQTSKHDKYSPGISLSTTLDLPYPSCDTLKINTEAHQGLKQIFQSGLRYARIGIILLDISLAQQEKTDLFQSSDSAKSLQLMKTLDHLQKRYGSKALYLASELKSSKKRCGLSPSYTTSWDELPIVS